MDTQGFSYGSAMTPQQVINLTTDQFKHQVTIKIIQNLSVFYAELIRSRIVLIRWQNVVVYVYRKIAVVFFYFFGKIKHFHSSKVTFQRRFSSNDHLNVLTTNNTKIGLA